MIPCQVKCQIGTTRVTPGLEQLKEILQKRILFFFNLIWMQSLTWLYYSQLIDSIIIILKIVAMEQVTITMDQIVTHLTKYDVMYLGEIEQEEIARIISCLSSLYGITVVLDKYRLRKYPSEHALIVVGSNYYMDRMEAYGVAC